MLFNPLSEADGFLYPQVQPQRDTPPISVALPIPDRDAVSGEAFTFRLPDGSFTAPAGVTDYFAQLDDGNLLPSWLTFDPSSQLFSGTPPADFTGALDIRVWAYDPSFNEIYDTFHLRVRPTNDAPTANPIANQSILEDAALWKFKIPAGTFADDDSPALVYRANVSGNMPLPAWLHFDTQTLTFMGTPPKDFFGVINLEVTADDGSRAITAEFSLTVKGTPDAPAIIYPIQDRYELEDTAINFMVPAGTFADPDGDVIKYTATLANGAALPAWLHFDPLTQTFSGQPPANYFGTLSVAVVASDKTHSTPAIFDFDILPVNDAPVLAIPIPDTLVKAGKAFTLALPAGTFTDVDSTLTYTATQADGSALPSWLHFDAATETFSGTPPAKFSAPVYVRLTASDGAISVTDDFVFAGGAPFVGQAIADQTIGQGAWAYVIPDGTFKDFDTPTLAYSVTLANGDPLPDWVHFDPATHTFSGTPPVDWDGREDFKVTVTDGKSKATDNFAVIKNGDLSWDLTGSFWGKSAPSEIHYRFDQLYFQSSNDWSTGFDAGFSSGPIYGGVHGNAGFAYNIQAGLLADLTIKPDVFNLHEGINIHEQLSDSSTFNLKPSVFVTGQMDIHTALSATTPDDAFFLHAFAGLTATSSVTLGGGIYGGFATPDIDLGIFGTIDIPDITFDASFNQTINLPGIPAITVADGDFSAPANAGAIDVTIKTGDPLVKVDLDSLGIGSISIGPPTGLDLSTYDVSAPGTNGLSTLHIGGTSAPFLSANLDLDQLAIKLVQDATGVDITQLFHTNLSYDLGGFQVGAKVNSDFGLVGSLAFKEDMYFTPQIYADYTTSFGETLTHVAAGQEVDFVSDEGEGTFTVNATYTTEADITTNIALVANMTFDMTLLKASLQASVGEGPISFTIGNINLPAAYSTSLNLVQLIFPIFSNTDHYVLDQTHSDSFTLSYERFRTTQGSGDNWTMTTHQTDAFGNENANHLIGNGLDDNMSSLGGDDVLEGMAGSDTLNGGDGNDTLYGGDDADLIYGGQGPTSGDDIIYGGAGDDLIDSGEGNDTIYGGPGHDEYNGDAGDDTMIGGDDGSTFYGGDGNDIIKAGAGDDTIEDLTGLVNITDTGGHNAITVGDQGCVIKILAGSNSITSGLGVDNITTGAGDDTLIVGGGNDKVNAGDGANALYGGDGNDILTSGSGADFISGDAGDDVINAGNGSNNVYGGLGNDKLTTGSQVDVLLGGDGNDHLYAGAGDDFVHGDAGKDTLDGGLGADTLVGGLGKDVFVYEGAADSTGASYDTLVIFEANKDKFDLPFTVSGIDKAQSGALSSATFDQDMAAILGPAKLLGNHAVLVTGTGGLAGQLFLVVDANNVAGYQAGQDYVILLESPTSTHVALDWFI